MVTYASGRCPICDSDKVKLITGLTWKCENCQIKIGRAYRFDPTGRFLHLASTDDTMNKRERLKKEWNKLTKENPDKKYRVSDYGYEIEEISSNNQEVR